MFGGFLCHLFREGKFYSEQYDFNSIKIFLFSVSFSMRKYFTLLTVNKLISFCHHLNSVKITFIAIKKIDANKTWTFLDEMERKKKCSTYTNEF